MADLWRFHQLRVLHPHAPPEAVMAAMIGETNTAAIPPLDQSRTVKAKGKLKTSGVEAKQKVVAKNNGEAGAKGMARRKPVEAADTSGECRTAAAANVQPSSISGKDKADTKAKRTPPMHEPPAKPIAAARPQSTTKTTKTVRKKNESVETPVATPTVAVMGNDPAPSGSKMEKPKKSKVRKDVGSAGLVADATDGGVGSKKKARQKGNKAKTSEGAATTLPPVTIDPASTPVLGSVASGKRSKKDREKKTPKAPVADTATSPAHVATDRSLAVHSPLPNHTPSVSAPQQTPKHQRIAVEVGTDELSTKKKRKKLEDMTPEEAEAEMERKERKRRKKEKRLARESAAAAAAGTATAHESATPAQPSSNPVEPPDSSPTAKAASARPTWATETPAHIKQAKTKKKPRGQDSGPISTSSGTANPISSLPGRLRPAPSGAEGFFTPDRAAHIPAVPHFYNSSQYDPTNAPAALPTTTRPGAYLTGHRNAQFTNMNTGASQRTMITPTSTNTHVRFGTPGEYEYDELATPFQPVLFSKRR